MPKLKRLSIQISRHLAAQIQIPITIWPNWTHVILNFGSITMPSTRATTLRTLCLALLRLLSPEVVVLTWGPALLSCRLCLLVSALFRPLFRPLPLVRLPLRALVHSITVFPRSHPHHHLHPHSQALARRTRSHRHSHLHPRPFALFLALVHTPLRFTLFLWTQMTILSQALLLCLYLPTINHTRSRALTLTLTLTLTRNRTRP